MKFGMLPCKNINESLGNFSTESDRVTWVPWLNWNGTTHVEFKIPLLTHIFFLCHLSANGFLIQKFFHFKFCVQTKLAFYNWFLLEKIHFVSECKVKIYPQMKVKSKLKFYENLAFQVFGKLCFFLFSFSFVRIYPKIETFIEITTFKTFRTRTETSDKIIGEK